MTPFDKIDGKPIDLKNPLHRDIIVARNKNLEFALRDGLAIEECRVSIAVRLELDCLKCGTRLDEENNQNWDGYDIIVSKNIPNLKCPECHSCYNFVQSLKQQSVLDIFVAPFGY